MQVLDEQTWLIGGKLVLSRIAHQTSGERGDIPRDTGNHCYSLRELDNPLLDGSLSSSTSCPLVYDVGDAHAIWKIGKAYLKIVKTTLPHVARDHSIFNAMHQLHLVLDVDLPKVLYHSEWDARYYITTSEVSRQTLEQVWPQMDEPTRTK